MVDDEFIDLQSSSHAAVGIVGRGSAQHIMSMLLFSTIISLQIHSSVAVQAGAPERNRLMRREHKKLQHHLDLQVDVQSLTSSHASKDRTDIARKMPPQHEDLRMRLATGTIAPPEQVLKTPRSARAHRFHASPLHKHRHMSPTSFNVSRTSKELQHLPGKSFVIGSSGIDPLVLGQGLQTPAPTQPPPATAAPAQTAAPTAQPATVAPAAVPAPAAAAAPVPDSGGGGWLFFFFMIILIGGALVAVAFFVHHKMHKHPAASRLLDTARPTAEDTTFWKTAKHRQSVRKLNSDDQTDEEVQSPRQARRSARQSYSQSRKPVPSSTSSMNLHDASQSDFGHHPSEPYDETASASMSSYRGRRERAFSRSLSQPPKLKSDSEGHQSQVDYRSEGSKGDGTPTTPMSARARRDRTQVRRDLTPDDEDEKLVV